MTHAELVRHALGIHSAVLLGAIVAFYHYGDRSDLLTKSLRGTDSTMARLRRHIADELRYRLNSVFEVAGSVPSLILRPGGETYVEHPVNPVDSEAYREVLRDFVEQNSGPLADCRSLRLYRESWLFWARFLSWSILVLLVFEAIASGVLGLVEWILGQRVSDSLITFSGIITAVSIASCLLPLPFLLRRHDAISKLRLRYDEF